MRDVTPVNPCQPSPCGPNSRCQPVGESPSCSCLENFYGQPPNCRPECVTNSECPSNNVCRNNRCVDPCPGLCGNNALCRVISHTAMCYCENDYTGDPFIQCTLIVRAPTEVVDPCNPNPCGSFAECLQQNSVGSCKCLEEYFGNPYEGCRPECILNTDCPSNKACINQKCRDPCPGTCGLNAECYTRNHLPTCSCLYGFVGDPYRYCAIEEKRKHFCFLTLQLFQNHNSKKPTKILAIIREYVNPCQPSPCGPNSQCRELNGQAVCSCLPEFISTPPACRPECTISTECNFDKACINQKCADPCPGVCGTGAQCQVRNHAPLCSCQLGYTGDPFTVCYPIPREFLCYPERFTFYNRTVTCTALPPTSVTEPTRDPCLPSPCGPNSQCRNVNHQASCSCLPNFFGAPPNCRPECVTNSECSSNLACINNRCTDPCPGSCAYNAQCNVINHIPICSCPRDYIGDPFVSCQPAPPRKINKYAVKFKLKSLITLSIVLTAKPPVKDDPCDPSPCGPNAVCNDGQCTCISEYQGDPYVGCRPECVLNSECPHDKACIRNKCVDPCPGTCGVNAICEVLNHVPMCRCPDGMSGNAFYQCDPIPRKYYFVAKIIAPWLSFSPLLSLKQNLSPIPVNHHHVVQIAAAVLPIKMLSALVSKVSSAIHLHVDQSVFVIQIAVRKWHVRTKNASILVPELVVLMLFVK